MLFVCVRVCLSRRVRAGRGVGADSVASARCGREGAGGCSRSTDQRWQSCGHAAGCAQIGDKGDPSQHALSLCSPPRRGAKGALLYNFFKLFFYITAHLRAVEMLRPPSMQKISSVWMPGLPTDMYTPPPHTHTHTIRR